MSHELSLKSSPKILNYSENNEIFVDTPCGSQCHTQPAKQVSPLA